MTLGDRLSHESWPAQLATPIKVFARPADTYVAGFIDAPAMHFLPASLACGGLVAGLTLPLPDDRHPAGAPRARRRTGCAGRSGRAAGLGGIGPWPPGGQRAASPTVRLAGPPPDAERLSVAPLPEHLHLFVPASGRRIDPVCEETTFQRLAAVDTAY